MYICCAVSIFINTRMTLYVGLYILLVSNSDVALEHEMKRQLSLTSFCFCGQAS